MSDREPDAVDVRDHDPIAGSCAFGAASAPDLTPYLHLTVRRAIANDLPSGTDDVLDAGYRFALAPPQPDEYLRNVDEQQRRDD